MPSQRGIYCRMRSAWFRRSPYGSVRPIRRCIIPGSQGSVWHYLRIILRWSANGIWSIFFTRGDSMWLQSSLRSTDSGERPIPENTWEVPSMRRRVFRSGRSATGTRGGLPTRRCTRSRWREQVGCGRVIPKLYRAIGCLRRFRAGSHWPGAAQSQQNAHRRTDSRRTIRGGGGNMCAGWLSRDMLRRRSATGGGRISGCPVFKESHLFYTKSDLYSVLFVNKVCEYAGIARKAEEMLFFYPIFQADSK